MGQWALSIVGEMINEEMQLLKPIMHLPKHNLSKEALLRIAFEDMICM
jgi:hypothetical protein